MSCSASCKGRKYGVIFSYKSPGKNPSASPASTAGRVRTMRDMSDHCPFLNRSDRRCSEKFRLSHLQHAFTYCFDEYQSCPVYAEQLADELGVYKEDPLGHAGFLQSFLFRAARLVVDTGLHTKRWSREQATDYKVQTTGFARPRSQREVERYCVSNGQACSYKVGHMAWVRARDESKRTLGDRFDIKQFHEVIREGAMPLSILERRIRERNAAFLGGSPRTERG